MPAKTMSSLYTGRVEPPANWKPTRSIPFVLSVSLPPCLPELGYWVIVPSATVNCCQPVPAFVRLPLAKSSPSGFAPPSIESHSSIFIKKTVPAGALTQKVTDVAPAKLIQKAGSTAVL